MGLFDNRATAMANEVKFGYSWAVARQIDRTASSMMNDKSLRRNIQMLKVLAKARVEDRTAFEEEYQGIADAFPPLSAMRSDELYELRLEQLSYLMDALAESGVLIDQGIPEADLSALERPQ